MHYTKTFTHKEFKQEDNVLIWERTIVGAEFQATTPDSTGQIRDITLITRDYQGKNITLRFQPSDDFKTFTIPDTITCNGNNIPTTHFFESNGYHCWDGAIIEAASNLFSLNFCFVSSVKNTTSPLFF